ncbi:MAG: hypothetical protein IT425_01940 [Pirellulales bacterium]|nr:hypothetical protein [Pirellulales bacterium]
MKKYQMIRNSHATILLGASAISLLAGCYFGPAAVKQPGIDASRAGSLAIETYDKDGNGVISGTELDQAPALKAALPRLDTNGDKGVSADEVAERVNAWKAMQSGMTSVRMHFRFNGQPLAGATITLEPESFLGNEVKQATGATSQFGDASPSIAPEDRPAPNLPGGAHFGLYKVRVSKVVNGRETIPARYNTETTLGQEVSYDDPGMKGNNITFALKSEG